MAFPSETYKKWPLNMFGMDFRTTFRALCVDPFQEVSFVCSRQEYLIICNSTMYYIGSQEKQIGEKAKQRIQQYFFRSCLYIRQGLEKNRKFQQVFFLKRFFFQITSKWQRSVFKHLCRKNKGFWSYRTCQVKQQTWWKI